MESLDRAWADFRRQIIGQLAGLPGRLEAENRAPEEPVPDASPKETRCSEEPTCQDVTLACQRLESLHSSLTARLEAAQAEAGRIERLLSEWDTRAGRNRILQRQTEASTENAGRRRDLSAEHGQLPGHPWEEVSAEVRRHSHRKRGQRRSSFRPTDPSLTVRSGWDQERNAGMLPMAPWNQWPGPTEEPKRIPRAPSQLHREHRQPQASLPCSSLPTPAKNSLFSPPTFASWSPTDHRQSLSQTASDNRWKGGRDKTARISKTRKSRASRAVCEVHHNATGLDAAVQLLKAEVGTMIH